MRLVQTGMRLLISVIVLLFVLVPMDYLAAATNSEIILTVEEPGNGDIYSGVGNLRGWAVAPQGINHIELSIDNVYRTNIPSGGLRTDVGNAYPSYPNSDESGFSMAFNYSNLTAGTHTIIVRAVDNNGNDRATTVAFNVARFDNPFISNSENISLNGSAVTYTDTAIYINSLLADGKRYNIRLEWSTAIQGFAIKQIVPVGASPDVTGLWEGSTHSKVDGSDVAFSVNLIQEDSSNLKGTVNIPSINVYNANFRGTIAGDAIRMDGVDFNFVLTGKINPSYNSASGEYHFYDINDWGTWQATKIK